jgi:hypothetical protein
MSEIHVVVRRVNPALKIDLVQVGRLEDGQFEPLPFDAIENFHFVSLLKSSHISDSLYVNHSDISNLIAACENFPGFRVEFFENTFVLIFNFRSDCDEGAAKEEGKRD